MGCVAARRFLSPSEINRVCFKWVVGARSPRPWGRSPLRRKGILTLPVTLRQKYGLNENDVFTSGASRALLLLAEAGRLTVTIPEQVVVETERALARKLPQALPAYREALHSTGLRIVRQPSRSDVEAQAELAAHAADVAIVVAAMQARADYFVTLNRRLDQYSRGACPADWLAAHRQTRDLDLDQEK